MSQFSYANAINPETDGGNDLNAALDAWELALQSNNSGASRPGYLPVGGTWLKIVSASQHDMMYWEGTNDIKLFTVNPTTNDVYFSFSSPQTFDGSGVPVNIHADSNSATNYPMRIYNSALSVASGFGAYAMSNKLGSATTIDYTMNIGDDLFINANTVVITSGAGGEALILKDNSDSGVSANPYFTFKDNVNAVKGLVGFASTANDDMDILNNLGNVDIGAVNDVTTRINGVAVLSTSASNTTVSSATGGTLLIAKDTGAAGNAANPSLGFYDSANTKLGYIGCGSVSNPDMYHQSQTGGHRFYANNVLKLNLDSTGLTTIYGGTARVKLDIGTSAAQNGGGSFANFWDNGAGTGRLIGWSQPEDAFTIEDNASAEHVVAHAGNSLALGQTWQTPSRLISTTYTNSTGASIQVIVSQSSSGAGSSMTLTVDGLLVSSMQLSTANTGGCITAIVPDGSTYVFTGTQFNHWRELR